jgi:protein TonB
MFTSYQAARHRKLPSYAAPLMFGSAVFVAGMLIWMWLGGIWAFERLDPPKDLQDLALAAPPPPPPPPPKGGAKPKDQTIQPKKVTVKDIVQPVKIEKQDQPEERADTGSENGVEGGDEGGAEGGDPNGQLLAPPPPPPPPPPAPPQNVAPTALEASRIGGEKNITPDDVTKTEISRSGKDRLIGSFKLCLTATGDIASVTQLRSTGFPAYDQKIVRTIRGEWRYHAYEVNGKAAPVCTAVTFIYSQH